MNGPLTVGLKQSAVVQIQKTPTVSLVIPGRNCESTLRSCLDSVVPMLKSGELCEIIFVDDGSQDASLTIAQQYPIQVLSGPGRGAAAARNVGIKAARGELIWFVDSDCIVHPNCLGLLVAAMRDGEIAGVGGGLSNACPESLLARLIDLEINWRHDRMPDRVNFVASGNAMYRRGVLETIGGFDESFRWAHDAELAFQVRSRGYELAFARRALVSHHHFVSMTQYLHKQMLYAKNRIYLYRRYPERAKGDSYSSWLDHIQPPMALLAVVSTPLLLYAPLRALPILAWSLLLAIHLPLSIRLGQSGNAKLAIAFWAMSTLRSVARAIGAVWGIVTYRSKPR